MGYKIMKTGEDHGHRGVADSDMQWLPHFYSWLDLQFKFLRDVKNSYIYIHNLGNISSIGSQAVFPNMALTK